MTHEPVDTVGISREVDDEPIEVECATQSTAELIRGQYPDCLHEADDKRSRTVKAVPGTPSFCLDEMTKLARESWSELENQHGQATLTDHEKEHIDFTQVTVFHARSCKAIAQAHCSEDWIAYYDHTLTVDEHRDIYANETASNVTFREIPTEKWTANP